MKKEKIIFWNVDTQYDFMRNDKSFKGALPIKGARKIEKNLGRLTKFAVDKGILIVSTADWHTPASKEFSDKPDYKTTFPRHCLQRTRGACFVPATNYFVECSFDWVENWYDKEVDFCILKNDNPSHIVIYKDDFDVFKGNPYTNEILKIIKPTIVVVYGVATNVCVDFAIKGLRKRKIEVFAVIDAMKELPGCDEWEVYRSWNAKGVLLVGTENVPGLVNRVKNGWKVEMGDLLCD